MPLRRIVNLISGLPAEAKLFVALEISDRVTWSLERELMTSTLELLDLLVRKNTKLKDPLINEVRPASVLSQSRRKKVQSMSDPKVREFFGAGRVHYTPARDAESPSEGTEAPPGSASTRETDMEQSEATESLSPEDTSSGPGET